MAPRLLRIEWEIQIFSPSFSKNSKYIIYHDRENFQNIIYYIWYITMAKIFEKLRKKIWISHSMHKSLGGI